MRGIQISLLFLFNAAASARGIRLQGQNDGTVGPWLLDRDSSRLLLALPEGVKALWTNGVEVDFEVPKSAFTTSAVTAVSLKAETTQKEKDAAPEKKESVEKKAKKATAAPANTDDTWFRDLAKALRSSCGKDHGCLVNMFTEWYRHESSEVVKDRIYNQALVPMKKAVAALLSEGDALGFSDDSDSEAAEASNKDLLACLEAFEKERAAEKGISLLEISSSSMRAEEEDSLVDEMATSNSTDMADVTAHFEQLFMPGRKSKRVTEGFSAASKLVGDVDGYTADLLGGDDMTEAKTKEVSESGIRSLMEAHSFAGAPAHSSQFGPSEMAVDIPTQADGKYPDVGALAVVSATGGSGRKVALLPLKARGSPPQEDSWRKVAGGDSDVVAQSTNDGKQHSPKSSSNLVDHTVDDLVKAAPEQRTTPGEEAPPVRSIPSPAAKGHASMLRTMGAQQTTSKQQSGTATVGLSAMRDQDGGSGGKGGQSQSAPPVPQSPVVAEKSLPELPEAPPPAAAPLEEPSFFKQVPQPSMPEEEPTNPSVPAPAIVIPPPESWNSKVESAAAPTNIVPEPRRGQHTMSTLSYSGAGSGKWMSWKPHDDSAMVSSVLSMIPGLSKKQASQDSQDSEPALPSFPAVKSQSSDPAPQEQAPPPPPPTRNAGWGEFLRKKPAVPPEANEYSVGLAGLPGLPAAPSTPDTWTQMLTQPQPPAPVAPPKAKRPKMYHREWDDPLPDAAATTSDSSSATSHETSQQNVWDNPATSDDSDAVKRQGGALQQENVVGEPQQQTAENVVAQTVPAVALPFPSIDAPQQQSSPSVPPDGGGAAPSGLESLAASDPSSYKLVQQLLAKQAAGMEVVPTYQHHKSQAVAALESISTHVGDGVSMSDDSSSLPYPRKAAAADAPYPGVEGAPSTGFGWKPTLSAIDEAGPDGAPPGPGQGGNAGMGDLLNILANKGGRKAMRLRDKLASLFTGGRGGGASALQEVHQPANPTRSMEDNEYARFAADLD